MSGFADVSPESLCDIAVRAARRKIDRGECGPWQASAITLWEMHEGFGVPEERLPSLEDIAIAVGGE